jgi:MYXO-CTERM domain-containing protein
MRRWKLSLTTLALVGTAWSAPAWADIAPPDQCSQAGAACENAGDGYDQAGLCVQRTCTKGPPSEQYSYDCLRCELKAMAGGDSGPADGGPRDSGTVKDSGTDASIVKDSSVKNQSDASQLTDGNGPSSSKDGSVSTGGDNPTHGDDSVETSAPDASPVPHPGPSVPGPAQGTDTLATKDAAAAEPTATTRDDQGGKAEDDGCSVSASRAESASVAAWLLLGVGMLLVGRRR